VIVVVDVVVDVNGDGDGGWRVGKRQASES
jgi:hypothetical protein